MLIMPPGHQTRIAQRRPFTKREKWGGLATGLITLAVLVAAIISFASSDPKVKPGCLDVSFASSLGNQRVTACGSEARAICAGVRGFGSAYSGRSLAIMVAGCKRAGDPT